MKSLGILEKMGDALNPIVVKELRQAVQSRFVMAMLLFFLLLQLLFMGIYLMVNSITGTLESAEFQAGRPVFAMLHGVLLAMCMLFLPAYSGFRLGAERSDVNVDLLFISTLRPRAIISGKLAAGLVLALLIFSACTPFMAFTYFLRGIDLASIFLIIGLDFLGVMGTVMLALFLAVVPANRVVKVLLGLAGLIALLFTFGMYVSWAWAGLEFGALAGFFERPEFPLECLAVVLIAATGIGFLFTCAVGLLSPMSANRALPMRLWVTLACLTTGVTVAAAVANSDSMLEWLYVWILLVAMLISLCIFIAINEREDWAPRVARTIPRRWWLRLPAFFLFSGAAGGVLWACLLFAGCWAASWYLYVVFDRASWAHVATAAIFGYTYCYALSAVFLRCVIRRIAPIYTWLVAVVLIFLGSIVPFLVTFLVRFDWNSEENLNWLVSNPIVGLVLMTLHAGNRGHSVIVFLTWWAAIVTLLNVPWFFRQIRRFRPFAGTARVPDLPPNILSASSLDATKTLP
jgi:hypothetical protein